MADFTWIPSYSTAIEISPKLKIVQMGDGYIQSSSDGIHPTREKWSLVFRSISDADYAAIAQFLRDNLGYAFNWTPPGETTPRRFLCSEPWKREYVSYNVNNVSVTLIEVFQ